MPERNNDHGVLNPALRAALQEFTTANSAGDHYHARMAADRVAAELLLGEQSTARHRLARTA